MDRITCIWCKNSYAKRDDTPLLYTKQPINIKNIPGSVLYYAREVDITVLMPLNSISTEQTKATEKVQASSDQLLDYLTTYPDATIHYHASDMILHIHLDASYLSVSKPRRHIGGKSYCGYKLPQEDNLNSLSSMYLPSSIM